MDRLGAHRVLLGGMALFSASIVLAGLVPVYWLLLPVALLAGLGNSVFHPADYSILNASVDPRRIGRGYSVHSISGNLGWAVAPIVVVGLTAHFGWRVALVTVGAAGLAVVAVLATQLRAFAGGRPAERARSTTGYGVRLLLTAPILSAFAYFALIATALIGLQTFGVTTLMRIYDTPLSAGHRCADRVPGGWGRGHPGRRPAGRPHGPARYRRGGGADHGRRIHDAAGHRRAGPGDAADRARPHRPLPRGHRALARHAGARRPRRPVPPARCSASSTPGSTWAPASRRSPSAGSSTTATRVMLFVAVGILMLFTIATVVQVRRIAQPAPAGA